MKHFIYISLLSLGVFATSCSKEEVVIADDSINSVPTWDNSSSEKKSGQVEGGEGTGESGSAGQSGVGPTGGVLPVPGDITDPNNDPDGKKKRL